jgi:hypothetical protein
MSGVPTHLKIAGIFFRSIVIVTLFVVVARVATPQHIGRGWLDISLGDFIRAALGLGFCLWMLAHLFILPRDAEGYRTWIYLGIALIPLLLAFITIW